MARKRRRLNWGPILWLLVVVNLIFGLMYSKLTSPEIIRVEGAEPSDQKRIEIALMLLTDKPALTAPKNIVLQELYRRPDVRVASLELNLLRRGLIKIEYEQKVAVFTLKPNLALTKSGKLVPFSGESSNIAKLKIFPGSIGPIGAFTNGWETLRIAEVCERALKA